MPYSLPELTTIALVMTFGSVLQGAVGFGSGLFGVPLLVLTGFSVAEAATINLTLTSVQNVVGAWRLWPNVELRQVVRPVLLRLGAIPVGAYVLTVASVLSPSQTKQMIGVVLFTIILCLLTIRPSPRDWLSVGWEILIMGASGFMLGFASIGGAPMVLYVNALTWSADKSRAFLFFCSATGAPFAGVLLWWNFGNQVLSAALAALMMMPLVFAGLWLGLHLGSRLNKMFFRRLTYGLLLAVAISSIVGPLLLGHD